LIAREKGGAGQLRMMQSMMQEHAKQQSPLTKDQLQQISDHWNSLPKETQEEIKGSKSKAMAFAKHVAHMVVGHMAAIKILAMAEPILHVLGLSENFTQENSDATEKRFFKQNRFAQHQKGNGRRQAAKASRGNRTEGSG